MLKASFYNFIIINYTDFCKVFKYDVFVNRLTPFDKYLLYQTMISYSLMVCSCLIKLFRILIIVLVKTTFKSSYGIVTYIIID